MLVYRYKNELNNIAESFFKDIKTLFFPEHEMTEKSRSKGAYIELFLDGKSCGYAVALNTSGKLKHYSHIFSDVGQMLFDEYQLENGYYIKDEIEKFVSLHMTVARGRGSVVRFVPVYMLSNSVSIFNPYYVAFGISEKINSRTKVLRGNGWVLLRLTLKEVAAEQERSAFNRAFSGNRYINAATDNSFLNDETYNIKKVDTAKYRPAFNFICTGKNFVLMENGYDYYVKRSGIISGLPVYGVNHSDRTGEYRSIRYSTIYGKLQLYYSNGNICFSDTESKRIFMKLLFDRS